MTASSLGCAATRHRSEKPSSACRDAMEQQQQHNTSTARLPSDPMFEFKDVDCKANKPIKTQPDAAAVSAADIEDLLLSADTVQSPLPAIKETGEIMVKLIIMYVILEVAAGLLKGNNPMQHLFLAAIHLKMVFRAMLAPLSMMCSGFVLALVQYSLLLKKHQRSSSSNQAIGQEAAAAVGKSKAE